MIWRVKLRGHFNQNGYNYVILKPFPAILAIEQDLTKQLLLELMLYRLLQLALIAPCEKCLSR